MSHPPAEGDSTSPQREREPPSPLDEDERRSLHVDGERRSPHTSIGPDGTLMFGDRHGSRWHVYDRRSGERRASRVIGQGSGFDRIFVNDAGEQWRYELRAEELIDETAYALERQLSLATRIDSGASS
jgi:hypothetical protein